MKVGFPGNMIKEEGKTRKEKSVKPTAMEKYMKVFMNRI